MQTAGGAVSASARVWAWAGTLAFFGSIGYFLFSFGVRFGRPGPADAPRAPAIAIDVILFTIFALHHSVFARERVRARIARLGPPGLERSFYVWVASLLFVAVCALWQPVAGVAWSATGPVRLLFVGLQAAGLWLALHSAAMIDVLELSGVRQLTPRAHVVEFKTTGPYGWMRHPIYTGWILMVFCAPTMTMTRLVFAAVSSVYLLVAIPFEERSLLLSSGGAYERYTRLVKWKLVPGVY